MEGFFKQEDNEKHQQSGQPWWLGLQQARWTGPCFLVSLQLHRQRHWSRRAIICSWRFNNIWVWREGRGPRLSRAGGRWWRCSSTSPGRPELNPGRGSTRWNAIDFLPHIFNLNPTQNNTTIQQAILPAQEADSPEPLAGLQPGTNLFVP